MLGHEIVFCSELLTVGESINRYSLLTVINIHKMRPRDQLSQMLPLVKKNCQRIVVSSRFSLHWSLRPCFLRQSYKAVYPACLEYEYVCVCACNVHVHMTSYVLVTCLLYTYIFIIDHILYYMILSMPTGDLVCWWQERFSGDTESRPLNNTMSSLVIIFPFPVTICSFHFTDSSSPQVLTH